jgi:hypothetical protein
MFTSVNLLLLDQETLTFTGKPVRAAGWYGHTNGLHTISMSVQNFTGRISIQAAVTTNPVTSDWFSILPGNVPYLQFPQANYVVQSPATGQTSTTGFSFASNVVWVQATVDRSYFLSPFTTPAYIGCFGLVEHILLNYGNNLGEYDYSWSVPGKGL